MSNFLPVTLPEFQRHWQTFRDWLEGSGSEVLQPTNEWEVARFSTPEGVGIIYKNKQGRISTWSGGAEEAWQAWRSGRTWRASRRSKRRSRDVVRKEMIFKALMERDGRLCMYCGEVLDRQTATFEHVVPLARGGPDKISNLTLACAECNMEAGHLSAREKFEIALKKRGGPNRRLCT